MAKKPVKNVPIKKHVRQPGEQARTTMTKSRFLKALPETFGLITNTCLKIGISRTSYHDWLAADPVFKAEVAKVIEESKERGLDFAEGKLYELMNSKEPSAVYFYLKCKGKERGFFEKSLYAIEKTRKPESPLTDEQKAKVADMLDGDPDGTSGISK